MNQSFNIHKSLTPTLSPCFCLSLFNLVPKKYSHVDKIWVGVLSFAFLQVTLMPFDTDKLFVSPCWMFCLLAKGIFLCKNSILSLSLVSIHLFSVPSLSLLCYVDEPLLGLFQLVICGLPHLSFIIFLHCMYT